MFEGDWSMFIRLGHLQSEGLVLKFIFASLVEIQKTFTMFHASGRLHPTLLDGRHGFPCQVLLYVHVAPDPGRAALLHLGRSIRTTRYVSG